MQAIAYFDKGAEAHPERIALVDGDARYSYRELKECTHAIARAMWASGLRVEAEERAAIYSINDARVMCCMLGLMRAGGVWVPINYRNALDANAQYMNYAGTAWLFYHSSFAEQVNEIRRRVPTLRHLVCIDAEDGGNPSLESFHEARRGRGGN